MSVGDVITLDDITGVVTSTTDGAYTVRWDTGNDTCEMAYHESVTWLADETR